MEGVSELGWGKKGHTSPLTILQLKCALPFINNAARATVPAARGDEQQTPDAFNQPPLRQNLSGSLVHFSFKAAVIIIAAAGPCY